jgi:hypothetical protein
MINFSLSIQETKTNAILYLAETFAVVLVPVVILPLLELC